MRWFERRIVGHLLVAAQLALLVGWGAMIFAQPWTLLTWGLLLVAFVLGVWALRAHPRRQLTPHPLPRDPARLVTEGPYRWIRHPMYSALMVGTLSLPLTDPTLGSWLLWGAVALTLGAKVAIEERVWRQRDPRYAAYAARTGCFIPSWRSLRGE